MFRRPLVIFMAVVTVLVGSAVLFLQSKTFAGMVRGFLSRTVPRELGAAVQFTDFQLKVFPPGVSIRNPELQLEEKNFLGIPKSSVLKASRIDLRFRPFQMLSGNIRVEQLRLVDADVVLELHEKKTVATLPGLRWNELVQIRLQSLALENSVVRLRWPANDLELAVMINRSILAHSEDNKEFPFLLQAELGQLGVNQRDSSFVFHGIRTETSIGPSGAKVRSFSALTDGSDQDSVLQLSGDIIGDLLNPAALRSRLQVDAVGDSGRLAEWLLPKKKTSRVKEGQLSLDGRFGVHGKLSADLLRIRETAVFEGRFSLERGQAVGWPLERLETALKARSESGKGAVFEIESAEISNGSDGKVLVGKTRVLIGPDGPVEKIILPLELDRAKLSWLTGPYAPSVDSLLTEFSGRASLELSGGRKWILRSQVELKSPGLTLLSGKGPSSRSSVLKTGPSRIEGTFQVDRDHFKPEDLQLNFEKSSFDIGGDISWAGKDTVWNLEAAGNTQLTDLHELGGSSIQGQGELSAKIHGSSKKLVIDFDADLSNASYIKLIFGELQGRMSLSLAQDTLQFQNVKGRIAETPYLINGPIDFKGAGSLDLGIEFLGGRIEDFLSVFHPLTHDISWFPQSLKGRMKAKGKVHGALGLDRLKVDLSMDGSNWAFMGERFRSVRFTGGFDEGRYHLENLQAKKRLGMLTGGVSFDSKGRFDWNFKTQGLSLRDLDWMLRLDIPIRGELQLSSEGSGTLKSLDSTTVISLDRTLIRSKNYPSSSLRIASKQGVFSAAGSALGKQVRLDWRHDPRVQAENILKVQAEYADFSPLLLLLNPNSIQDLSLLGRASGFLELSYQGASFERASGKLAINEFVAKKAGSSVQLAEPVSGRMVDGDLTMPEVRILSERGSIARLTLASRGGQWKCSLGGEVDLATLEFVTSLVQQGSGKADLDLALEGAFSFPKISGKVDLREGYIRTSVLESPLENLQGRLTLRSGKISLSGVHADLAQGRASASGSIEFFTDRFPAIDLGIQLDENRIKVYPFQYIKLRNARLRINGGSLPYDITGAVVVEQGLSREKLSSAGQGISLQSSLYAPPPSGDLAFDFPKFRLKIDVSADSGLQFQNEFLDVELKASVTVVNTIETPRILGKAELVPGQGKLNFKDHVFQIQSALVKFDNPAVINPVFDLVAATEISGTKVQLYTSGTADRFKVELSSNPVLPEPEILSLLAMGRTLEESQRLRAGSTSGVQQSEAASLILHSLDFNRDVREKTGFQVGVAEAVDTTTGSSIFRPQGDAESSVAPKIVLKRQIGKRMDVSVGSTVGSGTTNQKEVNADFYISPSVSLRGVWNYSEGSTAQESSVLQQSRTSYGVDLKLQKRFK